MSTVLSLRGSGLAEQPLVRDGGDYVLCWNGEAWRMGGVHLPRNDGEQVLDTLAESSREAQRQGNAVADEALRSIAGPFAFVFWDRRRQRLYYGRDRLGRRTLLMHLSGDSLRLSSVADEPLSGWREVEADGFYSLEIRPSITETMSTLTRHAWSHDESMVGAQVSFGRSEA
jgi:asparagine synthetase B (glutamine-hydrolysing)